MNKATTFLVLALVMVCGAEAKDVYRNNFATRTSRTAMPTGRWHEMNYQYPAPLYTNYSVPDPFDANLPYSNYERFQDGWTKQWVGIGNSLINFWARTDADPSNPCGTLFTAVTEEDAVAAHPFYNAFSNGFLRIQVDFRGAAKWPNNARIRFRPIFRQTMDPASGKGTYPLTFGLRNFGSDTDNSNYAEVIFAKDGDFERAEAQSWNLSSSRIDPAHWVRFVAEIDLDRKRWTCLAYDMGSAQPSFSSPTPETPLAQTPEFYFYRDMTAETGPITGIGIQVTKIDYSGSVSTLQTANAALVDNISVAWKRSATEDYLTCYENDFKIRRYRTIDTVASSEFNYAVPVAVAPAIYKSYFEGQTVSGPGGDWYAAGKPYVDRWFRNDYMGAKAQIQNGALAINSDNLFAFLSQAIGEELTSGKVRIVTDFRTPNQWSVSGSGHSMAVAMGPLSLTGQKEPGHEQLYAFRVGVAGPNDDLSRFYPYIYKNTGDETKIEWKANSWYRVDATADLDAKTFRCAFYDLGTATPKFETVGTLAYETGDLPFRGEGDTREQVDSIGALEIVVYRGGIGDDWNTRVACDNIRVWKQPAGASSWTEMFSTDFATTKRFNEKMAESEFMADVPNHRLEYGDQWIRRLLNAPGFKPTAKMTLRGAENACVRVSDARAGYGFAVQSFDKNLKGTFELQADIRAPYGYATKSDMAQASVAFGGEDFYQGDVCRYDGSNPHEASAYAAAVFGFRCNPADNTWAHDYLSSVRICAFDGDGVGGGVNLWSPDKIDSENPHWYRFKAIVDVQKSTYDLEVRDLGLTRPADDSVSGEVVAMWKGLGFRRRQTNGISAVGFGACGIVEPWNAPAGDCVGAALFDNIAITRDSGLVLLLK